jgi:hypothetical protein
MARLLEPDQSVVIFCPADLPDVQPLINGRSLQDLMPARRCRAVHEFEEARINGMARCCYWVPNGGHDRRLPIMAFDDLSPVIREFLLWSNMCPEEWFKLWVGVRGDDYCMALIPKMELALSRWRWRRLQLTDEAELGHDLVYNILMQPIINYCLASSRVRMLRNALGDHTNIGMMQYDPNVTDTKLAKALITGPYEVVYDELPPLPAAWGGITCQYLYDGLPLGFSPN